MSTLLRGLVKPITLQDIDAPPPMWQTMGRLFTYLQPYRRRMAITLSIYAVCVVITQLYPFIDRKLIDEHIAVNNPDGFLSLLALATLFHALAWVGVLIRSLLIQRVSLGILVDLRRQLFHHVVELSFTFHEKEPVGKTMTRFIGDIAVLKAGRIMELGNHETLVSNPDGYYAALVRAQASGGH